YTALDDISAVNSAYVYYRLKMKSNMGYIKYSKVVPISISEFAMKGISVAPNPIHDVMNVSISADADKQIELHIYDFAGRLVRTHRAQVAKGNSTITLNGFKDWQKGIYAVKVTSGDESYIEKVILTR